MGRGRITQSCFRSSTDWVGKLTVSMQSWCVLLRDRNHVFDAQKLGSFCAFLAVRYKLHIAVLASADGSRISEQKKFLHHLATAVLCRLEID